MAVCQRRIRSRFPASTRSQSPRSPATTPLFIAIVGLLGFGGGWALRDATTRSGLTAPLVNLTRPDGPALDRRLSELLELPATDFESVDVIELDLAVAREIPECRNVDVARYRKTVDDWAGHVNREVERHRYRFEQSPSEYKQSWPYFCSLMMRTVLDQDFGIAYDRDRFSFEDPKDLFVHGVIDQRRGTCISLPVLQIAIGRRLGWPIRPVAIPGHTFCRWDDPKTGDRLNIEAANVRGFVDHDDAYYRHWPFELDPRWEREHHVLKSLTMREYASVLVSALGSYFEARGAASGSPGGGGAHPDLMALQAAAMRYDALALWLDPVNRSAYVSLRLGVEQAAARHLDADERAGRKTYWNLKSHPAVAARLTPESNVGKRPGSP